MSESLEAHILELPYEGDQISMYILLPPFTKEDAIDNTLKKLTVDKFKTLVKNNNLLPKTVQVSLPKFTLEHSIELVPVSSFYFNILFLLITLNDRFLNPWVLGTSSLLPQTFPNSLLIKQYRLVKVFTKHEL